jgi:hypothetical protein
MLRQARVTLYLVCGMGERISYGLVVEDHGRVELPCQLPAQSYSFTI